MADGIVEIVMPHMGVSVTEGTVTQWVRAEGDAVRADDVVCEVTTDKVDTEVVAPADGVLARIVAAEGATVEVGVALALLATDGAAELPDAPVEAPDRPAAATDTAENGRTDAPDAATATATATATASEVASVGPRRIDYGQEAERVVAHGRRDGSVLASPVARRIAAANGIDLSRVVGSGLRGRIRKLDVLSVVEGTSEPSAAPAPVAPRPEAPTPTADAELPRGYESVAHEIVPLSPQRRAIAEHMVRSRRTAAHMTTEAEVDMQTVTRLRAELNGRRVAAGDSKLSFLPFIARATIAALREFPNLNATFQEDRLIRWKEVNLGIAVDTERGLMVPVVRNCESLTVDAIADGIASLAALARDRKLRPDDMAGGTFTISNPGSIGAVSAMAIINQPQVAILGTPAIVKRPVVVVGPDGDDMIAIRPIMTLALTFDHRAVDGAEATRCVVRIKQHLESFDIPSYA